MQTIKANVMPSVVSKMSLACLVLLLMGRAGADEARTVLERAIRAHGGADKMERTKRGRLKARVSGRRNEEAFKWVWEEAFDLPGRFHWRVEGTAGGRAVLMEYAIKGTRGWSREGENSPQNVRMPEPEPLEWHWHAILAQLLLFSRSGTDLKFLGEEMKDGRRLAIISAKSRRAAAELYFDRATGLLARSVRPVPDPMAGKETTGKIGENVYDDYKEVQGVQYPMHSKAISPGSALEIKILSIEFLNEIDARDFAKPVVAGAAETPSPPEQPAPARAETPARWDMRLIVATLAVGSFVAVVWLLVRGSKTRKQETPPQ